MFVCIQWVYSDRPRDRGGRPISDVIDIDADHEDGQFEVDGSGDGGDDEDDVQSGDGDEPDASGGTFVVKPVCILITRSKNFNG